MLRQKLARFMMGRYGTYGMDKLSWFLFFFSIGASFVSMLIPIYAVRAVLGFLQTFSLVYWFFRFFSKNISARQKENRWFCKVWAPVGRFFKLQGNKFRDRKTHVYKKCPHCKAVLRLPKREGTNTVKCPRCSERFDVKG